MPTDRSVVEIVLLVVHIFGAVLFIGPAAVANSVFPRYLRRRVVDAADATGHPTDEHRASDLGVVLALHRISRGYGAAAFVVPVAGALLATVKGRWGEIWLWIAIALTLVAAALLAATIQAQQRGIRVLRAEIATNSADPVATTAVLDVQVRAAGTYSGLFNLAWLAVLVLMVWRPGG